MAGKKNVSRMKGITKRDLRAFLLGMLAMFAIDMVTDWKDNVESFKKGFRDGIKSYREKN